MIKLLGRYFFILFHLSSAFASSILTGNNSFSIGDKNTPSKLELELRHRLVEDNGLFVGYHQKTFWDFNHASSPILDSNYNPSIIFSLGEMSKIRWDIGVFEHLSNGKDANESRGLNMSYLHLKKQIAFSPSKMDLQLKIFVSYNADKGSKDIVDYNGIWSGEVKLHDFLPIMNNEHFIDLRIAPGGRYGLDFSKGNVQLTFNVRPTVKSHFYLFGQIFTGRNEYLIDYKAYHKAIRFGVLLN